MKNPTNENLKRKLESDNVINTYKDSIAIATRHLAMNKEEYIAGAITIKYKNRVNILISGYDVQYKRFCPNYFLHYKLIEYYKNDFDYMDLNGITGDFTDTNPYKGLDEFKLGFNPLTFEYIGEYDFIINDGLYKSMEQSGQLAKEFKRKEKSIKNES
jgi:lipid II:glycine glycyltransferase (peptidoglycan interpeptide bridge formation enzyme)